MSNKRSRKMIGRYEQAYQAAQTIANDKPKDSQWHQFVVVIRNNRNRLVAETDDAVNNYRNIESLNSALIAYEGRIQAHQASIKENIKHAAKRALNQRIGKNPFNYVTNRYHSAKVNVPALISKVATGFGRAAASALEHLTLNNLINGLDYLAKNIKWKFDSLKNWAKRTITRKNFKAFVSDKAWVAQLWFEKKTALGRSLKFAKQARAANKIISNTENAGAFSYNPIDSGSTTDMLNTFEPGVPSEDVSALDGECEKDTPAGKDTRQAAPIARASMKTHLHFWAKSDHFAADPSEEAMPLDALHSQDDSESLEVPPTVSVFDYDPGFNSSEPSIK